MLPFEIAAGILIAVFVLFVLPDIADKLLVFALRLIFLPDIIANRRSGGRLFRWMESDRNPLIKHLVGDSGFFCAARRACGSGLNIDNFSIPSYGQVHEFGFKSTCDDLRAELYLRGERFDAV